MTARGVFWVAGELAGADFVHPAAGDALDGENFWLSIEPQVPDEGRTSRRRDVSMAFATAKPLPRWKRFTDHFATRRPLLLRRVPFRAKVNAA